MPPRSAIRALHQSSYPGAPWGELPLVGDGARPRGLTYGERSVDRRARPALKTRPAHNHSIALIALVIRAWRSLSELRIDDATEAVAQMHARSTSAGLSMESQTQRA